MSQLKKIWEVLTKPEVYWRIFSLLLAMILWLLAAGDGTLGETERIINLNVELQNLPADLIVIEAPESVKVRLRGLSPLLNRGENAVLASIDLAGAVEGTETYSVEAQAPIGVEIVSVTPRWVSVYTEELSQSVFPVTLALLGVERTQMARGLHPEPAVVTVKGPRSILERVDHVVAYLSFDRQGAGLQRAFSVQALDAEGRSLSMLTIEPREIKVEQEVLEEDPREE